MRFLILTLSFVVAIPCFASDLAPLALYERCHKLLTNRAPERNHVDFISIKQGVKDSVETCIDMLKKASLVEDGSSVLVDPANGEQATEVLNTFHHIHASWFAVKELDRNLYMYNSLKGIQDIYDNTEPALYITRSLFDKGFTAGNIVNSNVYLRSVRTNDEFRLMDKRRQVVTPENYVWKDLTPFADQGPLLGVKTHTNEMSNLPYISYRPGDGRITTGETSLGDHYGAGVLGSPTYLLINIQEPLREFVVDGAVGIARKWSQAVVNDFLCRDLPIIRPEDADPFVLSQSVEATFRNYQTCTSCHATMDRMAMTIRNINYSFLGGYELNKDILFGSAFLIKEPVSKPAHADAWPGNPDPDFHQRPPTGNLYFRNYKGELVNERVSDLDSLGRSLASQNDFYICLAKRYYQYFTGIDVSTGDPADQSMTAAESFHKNYVVKLGENLASHQDLFKVVEEILRSPQFRSGDYMSDGLSSK